MLQKLSFENFHMLLYLNLNTLLNNSIKFKNNDKSFISKKKLCAKVKWCNSRFGQIEDFNLTKESWIRILLFSDLVSSLASYTFTSKVQFYFE